METNQAPEGVALGVEVVKVACGAAQVTAAKMATTVTVDKTRKTLVMAGWYRMDVAMGWGHCLSLDPAACLYLTAESELLAIAGRRLVNITAIPAVVPRFFAQRHCR